MKNHIATVTNIYEAFGKGNIPAIIDQLADNIQWEQWGDNSAQQAGVPWMLARTGKEGAFEFFKALGELRITDFRILSIMSNENQAAAEIIIEADVLATGGHFRDEEIHLWTFDEQGKVIRFRHYNDTAKHIAAARKNE
jgi:uncharacterized protein